MHPSRRSAANLNHSFLAATWVIAAVRREMYLATLIIFAISLAVLIGRGVWRMSQRSSAVKRRAETVFEGRQRLTSDEFSELFPHDARSIATRFRDILKGVLIVDALFIQPNDHLIADLGLGHVDGLEPYHLDGDVQSEYNVSLLPLFESIPDPSVADVVQYLASQNTTNKAIHRSRGSAVS
jgi:hypothetical protein